MILLGGKPTMSENESQVIPEHLQMDPLVPENSKFIYLSPVPLFILNGTDKATSFGLVFDYSNEDNKHHILMTKPGYNPSQDKDQSDLIVARSVDGYTNDELNADLLQCIESKQDTLEDLPKFKAIVDPLKEEAIEGIRNTSVNTILLDSDGIVLNNIAGKIINNENNIIAFFSHAVLSIECLKNDTLAYVFTLQEAFPIIEGNTEFIDAISKSKTHIEISSKDLMQSFKMVITPSENEISNEGSYIRLSTKSVSEVRVQDAKRIKKYSVHPLGISNVDDTISSRITMIIEDESLKHFIYQRKIEEKLVKEVSESTHLLSKECESRFN